MHALLQLAFPAAHLVEQGGPAAFFAFASVVAASLLVVIVVSNANRGELATWTIPVRARRTALNQRSRRAAFLRLRDPGAPGRSRPRAPGQHSPAA
ncbi:DUF6412 domain-containing protein [Amycolatopsis sp. NPDC051903]|uniref:DUF6412 domain-containing protein n=1 Tax=Amycolatopsis sp. NPDC051903 TaxID=3363936 RepID=UPI0037A89A9D